MAGDALATGMAVLGRGFAQQGLAKGQCEITFTNTAWAFEQQGVGQALRLSTEALP